MPAGMHCTDCCQDLGRAEKPLLHACKTCFPLPAVGAHPSPGAAVLPAWCTSPAAAPRRYLHSLQGRGSFFFLLCHVGPSSSSSSSSYITAREMRLQPAATGTPKGMEGKWCLACLLALSLTHTWCYSQNTHPGLPGWGYLYSADPGGGRFPPFPVLPLSHVCPPHATHLLSHS